MVDHVQLPPSLPTEPPWRLCHASSWDALRPRRDQWNRLSHSLPFRNWDWLETWWKHYGQQNPHPGGSLSLAIIYATDHQDQLVGVAPWYLQRNVTQGNVLRFLGSGDVCSDYLSLLCAPGDEPRFAHLLSQYLSPQQNAPSLPAWDLIDLTGVDAEDVAVRHLTQQLTETGCAPCLRATPSCWRLPLPPDWERYLQQLSKSHRKQLRRVERRVLDAGRCRLHIVQHPDELRTGIDMLVDFQRRRRHRQQIPTPFNDPRYIAFLHDVGARLLAAGTLWMHWVELEGRPAAVEFFLAGGQILYAYQGGIEPDLLDEAPGRLSHLLALRRAMEQRFTAIDFLRGDEPYKHHWRATARPSVAIRVVPPTVAARMRHQAWRAGENVKHWIKTGLGLHNGHLMPIPDHQQI